MVVHGKEVQRALARTMTHARASADSRRAAFLALAHELDAHATAEERHFYVPLLMVATKATATESQIAGAGVRCAALTRFQTADPGIPPSRANA